MQPLKEFGIFYISSFFVDGGMTLPNFNFQHKKTSYNLSLTKRSPIYPTHHKLISLSFNQEFSILSTFPYLISLLDL